MRAEVRELYRSAVGTVLREMERAFWTPCSGISVPKDGMFRFPVTAFTSDAHLDYLHFRILEHWNRSTDALKADLLLLDFLEQIFRTLYSNNLRQTTTPERHGAGKQHLESMERARDYILRHLDCDVSLSSIARSAYMSVFHFSRLFKEFTGCSPYRYLIEVRLQHAAFLLRETSVPVTEVCFACGFGSLAHFITSFRQRFKTSPLRYRKGIRRCDRKVESRMFRRNEAGRVSDTICAREKR